MAYNVIQLDKDLWTIEDGAVRMYLINGGTGALLLDTGFGSGDLEKVVSELVTCPVTVVNTHSHGDHTGGNKYFSTFYMAEADRSEIEPACPADAKIIIVKDGDVITAGDAELHVIDIHGHTPGSIALLDRKNRRLFSADSIARNFPVYMQFPGQDLYGYQKALYRFRDMKADYDHIYPCHGELEISFVDLENEISALEGILDGTIPVGEAADSMGNKEPAYWYKTAAIFYPAR